MDCKVRVKAQEKYGKGADYKEKVKEEGRIDFCEVLVKRWRNSGKASAKSGNGRKDSWKHRAGSCGQTGEQKSDRQHPKGSGKKCQRGKRQPQAKIKCAEVAQW